VLIEQFLNLDGVLRLARRLECLGFFFGQRVSKEFKGLQKPGHVARQRLAFDVNRVE